MSQGILFLSSFFLILNFSYSQESAYTTSTLAPDLLTGADAVVRDELVEIEVVDIDEVIIRTRRVTTILNENGESFDEAYDFYDDHSSIKKQSAVVYDSRGGEIKKFRKKDFKDRSAVGGGTLISDDRVSYMDYTARGYPYTVVYESLVEKSSTAFIRPWIPVSGYRLGVEKSSYSLKNPKAIPIRYKEENLDSTLVTKKISDFEVSYQLQGYLALKEEKLSPDFNELTPRALIALEAFSLMGVEGRATTWEEFGSWQYEHLLKDKTILPKETIKKMNALTAGVSDDLEKARRIYKYVQENTRYISVQLGIGGWEPMTAGEVDKMKYGDCKALTIYTKALLESQGIPSYYAVIYGGSNRKSLDPAFASMQGNHVILNIPRDEEDIWLECTSQTTPFNYLGNFTDNRTALLVKPEGGQIIRTKVYSGEENKQTTLGTIYLDGAGDFRAEVSRKSEGVLYGNIYHIARQIKSDQELYYKRNWGHLQNISFESVEFDNNRREQIFTEDLEFNGKRILSKAGNRLLLPLNFLIPQTFNLPHTGNRKSPLEISRGKTYEDTFKFLLPSGYAPEALPEGFSTESNFGQFEFSVRFQEEENISFIEVKRVYMLKEGNWPKESFEDFKIFMNSVNSISNQKAVLVAQ